MFLLYNSNGIILAKLSFSKIMEAAFFTTSEELPKPIPI